MVNLIPTFKCFYKDSDQQEGWKLCLGDDLKGDIEKQFKKAKLEGKILDYKFFQDGHRNQDLQRDYVIDRTSYWINLRDNWGYSPETETWFDEGELIPEPKQKSEIVNNIQISFEVEDEEEIAEYIIDIQNGNEDDAGLAIKIYFISTTNKAYVVLNYQLMIEELKQFLNDIENLKSARLYIYEYSEATFHVWQKDNDIRFIIQSSVDQGLEFIFDATMPREMFLNQFNNAIEMLEDKINEFKKSF